MRDKNRSKKKYYNFEKKRKTGKTYYIEMNNKNRKNWDFYKTRVGKKSKGEDKRPHNVPNEIMVQRMSANPSGRLKKYEPLGTRDFVPFNAFTELSIGNIKKACECFYNMPENFCDVLASDRGPSCSG